MDVLFGTPSYAKTVCLDYVTSMMETTRLLVSQGVGVSAHFIGGNCFIDLARNAIVEHFLKHTTAEYLFFVDADVGWPADAVWKLIQSPFQVTAGLVPKRDDAPCYHQNALTGEVRENWLQTVEAPTAFMCIRRDVFAQLDEAYPEYRELNMLNGAMPYFQTGIYGKGFIGEDIFFCRQWVKAGGQIWIWPNANFTHRGDKGWKGNFLEHGKATGLFTLA